MRRSLLAWALLVVAFWPVSNVDAGNCTVTAHPSWKDSLDFPGDRFIVTPTFQPRWVKFAILGCDPGRVYFQNSWQLPFHYEFATAHLDPFRGITREEFDGKTLYNAGREAVLGAVILPEEVESNPGEFGIQFVGRDPIPREQIVELFRTVAASVDHDGADAYYFPTFEQQASARENEEFLADAGVVVSSADRWSDGNSIYSNGWALGRLKFVAAAEIDAAYRDGRLRADDILLTDGVPAEVPFVAAILSLAPATPNSHVAILARNYEVPFVYLSVEKDAARAQELVGRRVIVSAYQRFDERDFRLFDIDDGKLAPELQEEILALKDLPPLELTPMVGAGTYSRSVADLAPADIDIVGGKAANYGFLLRTIPDNTRPAAAFTFDLWNEFLEQNLGGGRTLREEIAQRLAPFNTYPPEDVGLLADVLDGIRDLFRDDMLTAFSPALRTAVIETLQDPAYQLDPERRIRFRSSTNFEDSDKFTGAGLFDSRSGCLLDDLDADDLGPSRCDATRLEERGVFRAIRRVFASFYNDNAFLERLRWGVNEADVGMGVLVHHSFPDEIELANGVATLTKGGGPNYSIRMVTQVGATSVANPEGGELPETVDVVVFRSGGIAVDLVAGSNQVVLGGTVLKWRDEYEEFGRLFAQVAGAFEAATGKTQFSLDFEYKKITPEAQLTVDTVPDGHLVVKQVREIPLPDRERTVVPFLLNVPSEFTTFQGEAADVFSNHRLKSRWMLETRNMWLREDDLDAGTFTRVDVEYTDGCDVLATQLDMAAPEVEQGFSDAGAARVAWRWDHLANPRSYELVAGQVPLLVSPSESPFVTLHDLFVGVNVEYDHAVLGQEYSEKDPGPQMREYISLAVRPERQRGDLEQVRTAEEDGVTVTTRFFWPPPPGGIIAGYTAPLVEWVGTVIEGLTAEPIVLEGDWAQTYRPGHHNFTREFIFDPYLAPGVSGAVLDELEARGIRWIYVNGEGLHYLSACDLALRCACEESLFRRGDSNSDGGVDVSDPVFVLNYLFGGGLPLGCEQAADANDDNVINIADPVYELNHLFGGGPALPPPVEECGADPTPAVGPGGGLSCGDYGACGI